MPSYPSNGRCPICNWHEFWPVLVKVRGGVRESELRQCGACTAVFKDPSLFVRAMEFRLTAGAAEVMARIDPMPQIPVPDGSRTPWIWSRERPIIDTDVGRYMIGIGYSGWFGGVIVNKYGLGVEQTEGRPPIAANAANFYMFVDPPPPVTKC
jgi:hypothetical protein